MKVLIDLTPIYGRKATGVELYAIDLYKALIKSSHIVIPVFHVENTIDNNHESIIIKKTPRLLLENIILPKVVKNIKADVAIFPIFPPPINVYGKDIKIVPVLHDLAYLKYRSTLNVAAKYYLTPKMNRALKKATAIITISETVKSDASKITKLPIYNCGENIAEMYKGCSNLARLDHLRRWGIEPKKYIISVSTIEPRKNFKYLLKVIKPLLEKKHLKLVLVGRKGWGKDKELRFLIEEMKDLLIFTEYIDWKYLVSLYHFAYAFVLLSIDEGFGRTPFEALACGCKKIILSDIPIFRETFKEDALFLPLYDVSKCKKICLKEDIPEVTDKIKVPFDILERNIPSVLNEIEMIK